MNDLNFVTGGGAPGWWTGKGGGRRGEKSGKGKDGTDGGETIH